MAIAFARARPIHLTEFAGASREFAYVGRARLADPRAEIRPFDYSHLRHDLAHVEVFLPPDVPGRFRDPAVLANALDVAELRKIRTPLSERERKPQVVMAVIIALPPQFEVSQDEALMITRRIALYPCGSHPVPIHIAIHNAVVNRHAHAEIGLRSMNLDGSFGLKIPNLFARFQSHQGEASVAEGTGWPELTWEVQQNFFTERGMDLVVDPWAPAPEKHLEIEIPDEVTTQWINIRRQQRRLANVNLIKGSPTQLVETLLRGRATLRVAELRRLCARFFDNEDDGRAQVDRILTDQNVVPLTDWSEPRKPRYMTTRRTARLMDRASKLIERTGGGIVAVTGPSHDVVATRFSELYATYEEREPPLILGRSLSDCADTAATLARHRPVIGTLDMVMGTPDQRARGRARGVYMRSECVVIVPRGELIDDRTLARLLLAADTTRSKLLLGHDQSRQTGIVRRHLAAHIADRSESESVLPWDACQPQSIEGLLRSGLVRQGIEAMSELGVLNFCPRPDSHIGETLPVVVIDNPDWVKAANDAIRTAHLRDGLIEEQETLAGPRGEVKLSLGEWIVTTGSKGLPAKMDAHQLARVVAIDTDANWIDVVRQGKVARLKFRDDPAIRPAAAISIRDAWDAPPDAKLSIELADPRRVWAALLLAANRIGNARTYVDPAIAKTGAELVDAARRSLPAALPSRRIIRPDYDAEKSKILPDFDPFPQPDAAQLEQAPPPVGFVEDVRHRIAKTAHTRLAYRLLHEHVVTQNPDHERHIQRLLKRCGSELTKSVLQFLAERDDVPNFDETDHPLDLVELEPQHWSPWELYKFEQDLYLMTVRAAGWGLLPPITTNTRFLHTQPDGDPTTEL